MSYWILVDGWNLMIGGAALGTYFAGRRELFDLFVGVFLIVFGSVGLFIHSAP